MLKPNISAKYYRLCILQPEQVRRCLEVDSRPPGGACAPACAPAGRLVCPTAHSVYLPVRSLYLLWCAATFSWQLKFFSCAKRRRFQRAVLESESRADQMMMVYAVAKIKTCHKTPIVYCIGE
jgi:hypothetical protein